MRHVLITAIGQPDWQPTVLTVFESRTFEFENVVNSSSKFRCRKSPGN